MTQKKTNTQKKTPKKQIPQTPELDQMIIGNDKNSYLLRLGGKAESPTPLKIGHNLHVSIEGSITSEERRDNEDGSFTYTYKFNPVRIALLNEKGESIKMRDTRSMGQLFRALVYKRWMNAGSSLDAEEFYNAVMTSAMANVDKIIESANL